MALTGKRMLVTGAGTGIGREVALECARQGADVVLSYHASDQGARTAVDEILALGRRAWALPADLGDAVAPDALVAQAAELLGGLDVLINNAGVTLTKPFLEVSAADFDAIYQVNIRGQFLCAQAAARLMRDNQVAVGARGVILNMTSIHAYAGLPGHSVYAGTKGAIVAWTRELAVELAPLGIRVAAVAPGSIAVERSLRNPNYDPADVARQIPWGRTGQPADIARACVFLASDAADFIVGTTLVVDGGTTSRMTLYLDQGH